ncbi:hypothetical protein PUN28_003432 [Cardiocondyla obscurior]|uniref:Uncharacterized protein n=1 Tax=Cardiocondyla obscurior TaxID=286306 RepID=A0AAW2GLY4_9HYME
MNFVIGNGTNVMKVRRWMGIHEPRVDFCFKTFVTARTGSTGGGALSANFSASRRYCLSDNCESTYGAHAWCIFTLLLLMGSRDHVQAVTEFTWRRIACTRSYHADDSFLTTPQLYIHPSPCPTCVRYALPLYS